MSERSQACTLLISIDESFVNAVTPALHPRYRVIHCRPQHGDVDRAIKSFQPDVCIIDVDDLKWDDNFHLELIEEVNLLTSAPIIVATYDLMASLVVDALRAGARDVCDKTGRTGDIQDVVENLLKRRHKGPGSQTARLITLAGARPGVGTTTTALALAEAIARRLDGAGRVLFMDFSLPPAEAPDLLALPPKYYLTDAIEDVGRLDETFVENALARLNRCPLHLMPLCRSREEVEALETSDIAILLSVLKSFFHTIVIDANPAWRPELARRFLNEADIPLICCSQSVSAIHAGVDMVRHVLSESDAFAFHLLVTRHCERISPRREDMAAAFPGRSTCHLIEEDRLFVEMARNLGETLIRPHGHGRFEKSVLRLADALMPDLPAMRRHPLFSRRSLTSWWKELRPVAADAPDTEASRG